MCQQDKLVECVPNFSEGRRAEVVEAIVHAVRSVDGVRLLDYSMDPDHNRSVLTFTGEPGPVKEAAFRSIAEASRLIDMEKHVGEHPRIGATDVVPFVPVKGVSMEECVLLARELGKQVADELGIPVYLYGEAATRPDRINLAEVRKGQYEGLKEEIVHPDRWPDFGAPRMHPKAGATVIGARKFLIAYNINLGTSDVSIAKKIANVVRGSSGGLVNVRALGVMLHERNIVQVTMNLVDYEKTSLHATFNMVESEARRYGVPVIGSEVIGLVPLDALLDVVEHYLRFERFSRDQVLEARLWE